MTLHGHGWGDLPGDAYELECAKCEIRIQVNTEDIKNMIIVDGGLRFDRQKKLGRVLTRDVPALLLKRWDRLEPSGHLQDIAMFEQLVPSNHLEVIFWRTHRIGNRLNDRALRRNPIFCPEVGATPQSSIRVDTLHTIYLGVMAKFVERVIWATIDSNLFNFDGNQAARIASSTSRLHSDMRSWYSSNDIDHSDRISTLNGLIGNNAHRDLKTKAHETGVLLDWAFDFCQRHEAGLPNGSFLKVAGQTLVEYMGLLRSSPKAVPIGVCQTLLDLCLRHVTVAKTAGVNLVPKHHMWIHLTLGIRLTGNPRWFSCFTDESLNAVIATIAQTCHRAHWETKVFQKVRLLPTVEANSVFADI